MVEEKESRKEDSHGQPKDPEDDNQMEVSEVKIALLSSTMCIMIEWNSTTLDANIQSQPFANKHFSRKIYIGFLDNSTFCLKRKKFLFQNIKNEKSFYF